MQINSLVTIRDRKATTTSLVVAEYFGKRHTHVIDSISNLVADLGSEGQPNFRLSSYVTEQNKTQPMYEMNRDGFSLLVMSFSGKKALDWKVRFLKAFNQMEESLSGGQSLFWKDAVAVFPQFHGVAQLLYKTKSAIASHANEATRNLTGVDLLKLMNVGQNNSQYKNITGNATLLNGLDRLMQGDNLFIKDTFGSIVYKLDLIVSGDEDKENLPSSRSFRKQMEQLRPDLEAVGITFKFGKHTNQGFVIELTRQPIEAPLLITLSE